MNQAQACIRKLRFLNRGDVIEEIDNFGLLSNLLMRVLSTPTASLTNNNILLGTEDATIVNYFGIEFEKEHMLNGIYFDSSGVELTFCLPLTGCWFRSLENEYLPMQFRDLTMEVEFENPEDCWEHNRKAVIYSSVEFHGEFISLPTNMPSPENVSLSASSYFNKSLANIRPYSNIYEAEIPVICKSAKKCLIAITCNGVHYFLDRTIFQDQDLVLNGRRKSDPTSLNFKRYNFTHPLHDFGTRYSPEESYIDLLNAFHLDMGHKTHITRYGWAYNGLPSSYPYNDFMFCQKLELTPSLVSGTPLNSDLFFRLEYPDDALLYSSNGNNLNHSYLVNAFVHYDMLVVLDAAGKSYVDY